MYSLNGSRDQSAAGTTSFQRRRLDEWTLVVAVNNQHVLQNTLLASPAIGAECQVILKSGFSSAGEAYNAGIAEARHDIIVFAHQDVFLPASWTRDLEAALAQLEPDWGVLGLVGALPDRQDVKGYCYSTGLRRFVGEPFPKPVEVRSLDEIVLIVRRSSGLAFDRNLPGFHLYGTDICLQAEARGMRNYAIPAFCIHNTNGIRSFPLDFWRGYLYLRWKWRSRLPISTCCTSITKWCGPAIGTILRDSFRMLLWPRHSGARWDNMDCLLEFVEQERATLECLTMATRLE